MSKLSPINSMIKRTNLQVNTNSLLNKYAQNQPNSSEDTPMHEEEQPPEDKVNSIAISNFKSNKLSHIDKK